MNPRRI